LDAVVVEKHVQAVQEDWEKDLELIQPFLLPKKACYVLLRTEREHSTNKQSSWIFISYVPDYASVHEKMIYASSKAGVLRDLGESKFEDNIFATIPADLSHKGLIEYRKSKGADAPKTEKEKEVEQMKLSTV
jgi:twinfilin-like protein